ncbi:MAG: glycosyltransferase family 39 protein [Planctomycetota bacterium]
MAAVSAGGEKRPEEKLAGAALLAIAIAVAVLLMSQTFGGPWRRVPWLGQNGARYSIMARNFDRLGFLETRLAPVMSSGDPLGVPRQYYLHHPPLLPLTIGLAFRIAGIGEDVARAVAALFSLLNVLLVAALACRFWGPVAGGIAALLTAGLPFTGVYGVHVDVQGPQVLSFLLLTWLLLRTYRDRRKGVSLALAMVAFGLGMLSDWPAYYLGLIGPVVWWCDRGACGRAPVVLMPLAALFVFGLLRLQASLVGDPGGGLQQSLVLRSFDIVREMRERPDEVFAALQARLQDFLELYPWPVLLLAALGLLRRSRHGARLWSAGLASAGILHVALFPAGAVLHDYWTFALFPGSVLLATSGLLWIWESAALWRYRWLWRALAGLLLAWLLWLSVSASIERFAPARVDLRHVLLGRALAAATSASEIVLTNAPYNPVDGQPLSYPVFSYYSDRCVLGGVDDLGELHRFRAEPGAGAFFLVPPRAFPGVVTEASYRMLADELRWMGEVRELEQGVMLCRFRGP